MTDQSGRSFPTVSTVPLLSSSCFCRPVIPADSGDGPPHLETLFWLFIAVDFVTVELGWDWKAPINLKLSFSVMSVSVVSVSDVEQVSDLLDRTTRLFYFSELLWSTKYGTKTFNAVYPKVLDKITKCI